MRPTTAEKVLAWLLGINGGLALLAVFAVVMPTDWMEAGARWAGLDVFPRSTLSEYLLRSVSALYALIGALVLHLAFHARRYLDLIAFIGWLTVVLGAALTAIDFAVGMPASWSWGEGPPTIVVGAAFVWLARRAGAPA